MKTSTASLLSLLFVSLFSVSWAASANAHEAYLQCLSLQLRNSTSNPQLVYTPNNPSYSSILQFSIQNLRFASPSTPRPLVIITPLRESHVQRAIYCSRKYDVQIRIRSGGHDYEGLSYVAGVPFAMIDFTNMRSISVNVEERTAWVQAGARLGEVYYNIANKTRTLGFPAGLCPTVGIGGYISGGGYGLLLRKYGLAADNVIDARFLDIKGKILDRKSMGEDLFWAIRGGGGGSFGVVLAWKLRLVPVPETVTFFSVSRTLEQNATKLVHRWQYVADKTDEDLYIRILLRSESSSQNGKRTMVASFDSLFLGGVDRLLPLMEQDFPELGLVKENCTEMTWAEAAVRFAGGQSLDYLLNRTASWTENYKIKSDYVTEPIPEHALEGIWKRFYEEESDVPVMVLSPYGGKMSEISESDLPFPHRAGIKYGIVYQIGWGETGIIASKRHISWGRRLYKYMAPYVSQNPRRAYINYRDLDLGVNNEGYTSYAQASKWGIKYFNNNFDKLVYVKTLVDPNNFFRHEQSIPPLSPRWIKEFGHHPQAGRDYQ